MKSLSEMVKRGKGKYGTFCKICKNKREREYSKNNPEKKRERDRRWREGNPEKAKESDLLKTRLYQEKNKLLRRYKSRQRLHSLSDEERKKRYRKNDEWNANNKEWFRQYREKNKEKYSARSKLNYELSKGKIKKPKECQMCFKAGYIESHHPDYGKPLKVLWVCKECHGKLHVFQNFENEVLKKNKENKE